MDVGRLYKFCYVYNYSEQKRQNEIFGDMKHVCIIRKA